MSKRSKTANARRTAYMESGAAKAVSTPKKPSTRVVGRAHRPNQRVDVRAKAAAVIVAAVAVLAVIFYLNSPNRASDGGRDAYPFEVGNPGPGAVAPPIRLASTNGTTFDLAAMRGQTVLLFFQEGLMCQACWDQLRDMEANWDPFAALGIDGIVSITTDPLDLLQQKVQDEGLLTPSLSDPDLAVSRTYEANLYGMMGTATNGHSFVLVDEAGVIRWRADYGGAPKYTMYVPTEQLLADIREGIAAAGGIA